MFSVSDIYTRLKSFKQSLASNHTKFYFAKVDVQSAFDTIPQHAVVELMASIPSQAQYVVTKHAEVKPGEPGELPGDQQQQQQPSSSKAIRRWHANALADGDQKPFPRRLEAGLAGKKKNTVFVESAMRKTHSAQDLVALLAQHVEQNLVKVGKKYYRQKRGIPQGSVLSSFLCNYFYADLERKHLSFLEAAEDTLLLRLIDDFLLITLDRDKAVRFVETMHGGLPDYGVVVNPAKTLTNFDMWCVGDGDIERTQRGTAFPYCGTLIDTQTLDISKDSQRDAGLDISASLTVEYGRAPGQNFQRKVLSKSHDPPSPHPPRKGETLPLTRHQTPSRSNPTSSSSTRRTTRPARSCTPSTPPFAKPQPRCGRTRAASRSRANPAPASLFVSLLLPC